MVCAIIPEIIELESFGGDYEKYEDAVYATYKRTFENQKFYLENKCIDPIYKDKPGTFWHIVSSGTDESNRIPDLRRYERVAWPAHILGHCIGQCDKILMWKNKRNGKSRIILWCQDIDYVVVLDERKEFLIFWTAYPVTYNHTRKKLLKEYNEYIKQKALE